MASDLHALGVENEWYWLYQDRKRWSELYFNAVDVLVQNRPVLLTFFPTWGLIIVCVVSVSVDKAI